MLAYHSTEFQYPNRWNGFGWCDLKIYEHENRRVIILTSAIDRETGDNLSKGTSITNAIENIVLELQKQGHINWTNLIEHYPVRGEMVRIRKHNSDYIDPFWNETFASVMFNASRKTVTVDRWVHMFRQEVDVLIGEQFPDWHKEQL